MIRNTEDELLKYKYDVDQEQFPFIVDQGTTYDTTGNKHVWVSKPSPGLDKRQANFQLCIRAEGAQNIQAALLFRRKVNVTFLEETMIKGLMCIAWMDTAVNMAWCYNTLFPRNGKMV